MFCRELKGKDIGHVFSTCLISNLKACKSLVIFKRNKTISCYFNVDQSWTHVGLWKIFLHNVTDRFRSRTKTQWYFRYRPVLNIYLKFHVEMIPNNSILRCSYWQMKSDFEYFHLSMWILNLYIVPKEYEGSQLVRITWTFVAVEFRWN